MESSLNVVKNLTQKKPLLVIKKNNIIKASSLIFLKSPTKRPSPVQTSLQLLNSKRKCTESIQGSQTTAELTHVTPEIQPEPETETTSKKVSIISDVQIKEEFVIEQPAEETEGNKKKDAKKGVGRTGKHPSDRCLKHMDLPEHQAEGLVKAGDVFPSIQDFSKYAAAQAKHWYFYYAIVSSRNPKVNGTKYKKDKATIYTFACRFRKKAESQSRGIRKRNDVNRELNCQAGVVLRYKRGEVGYKVTHACHHHNHELSPEVFMKLPHGHRLPPELKEEIDDLASFEVAAQLIRQYVHSKTGLDLRKMVNNRIAKIRRSKHPREITPDKMKEVLAKIKYIKTAFPQEVPQKNREIKHRKTKRELKDRNRTLKPKIMRAKKRQSEPEYYDEVVITSSQEDEPCDQELTQSVAELQNTEADEIRVIPCEETQGEVGDEVVYEVEDDILKAENDYVIQTITNSNEHTVSPSTQNKQVIKIEGYKILPISSVRKPLQENNASERKTSQNYVSIETVESSIDMNNSDTSAGHCLQEPKEIESSGQEILITSDRKLKFLQPNNLKCEQRHKVLPEFAAEGSVEVGDMFESLDVFEKYASLHSKKWGFRYTCVAASSHSSRNEFGVATAFFRCTGLRTRISKEPVPCPALVALRLESYESTYTVTYACHHHNHNHTPSRRGKRGRGLSRNLRDEILDLAWLGLDGQIIRRHIYFETGMDLIQSIKNVMNKIKKETKREMPRERVEEILEKIKCLEKKYGPIINTWHRDKRKIDEDRKGSLEIHESSQSRVETRLNNIQYDKQLIKSVEELQKATGCDIQLHEEDANEVENDYATLQLQSVEDTGYYIDGNDKVEVDQELYAVDENLEYILSTQDESGTVYEIDISTSENIYTQEHEQTEEPNPSPILYHEGVEYSDDEYEDAYQSINSGYIKQEIVENVGIIQTSDKYCEETQTKDIAVQVDFELIELDSDYEVMNTLELEAISADLRNSKHTSNTRGPPKHFIEEGIINKFNIDIYISMGGVIPCLENLAISMNLPVLQLLKKIYKGEGVFKMTLGRSGQQNRKTVQLTYVPLTINFPYEKYKYTTGLQEYKKMCSKYSDVAIKLEKVVEELSAKLIETELRWKDAESHTQRLSKQASLSDYVLVSPQKDIDDAKTRIKQLEMTNQQLLKNNEQLFKKNKDLDELLVSNNETVKERDIMNKVNTLNSTLNESRHQNSVLRRQVTELEESSQKYIDDAKTRIKQLETYNKQLLKNNEQLFKKNKDLDELISNNETVKEKEIMKKNSVVHQNSVLQRRVTEHEEFENKRLSERIKLLENMLNESNNEKINITKSLEVYETDKKVIERILKEIKKHNNDLKKKLMQVDADHLQRSKELNEKIRVLERDLKSSKALISKLKQVEGPAKLVICLKDMESENEILRKEVKTLQEHNRFLTLNTATDQMDETVTTTDSHVETS